MHTMKRGVVSIVALAALVFPSTGGSVAHGAPGRPTKVLIVLFDQMLPKYANQFDMPNFRALRDDGTNFKNAYLGYMASETVISHNVVVSGQLPKHMGWTDEAYRDTDNLLGNGAGAMYITGDLNLANFGTLVDNEGYPKLADYLHAAQPGTKFITVGEKSYAVESATASSGDIAVRLSDRMSNVTSDYHVTPAGLADGGCRNLGGRWRYPFGKNVPGYLLGPDTTDPTLCGRYFINSDKGNDYGTLAAFPSRVYPEDGNRFFPGTDASAQAGHLGGDTWAADAAMTMMENENWSGMFVTLGGIDKAGHMWGADSDSVAACATGAQQTHVQCAAENADVQLGRMLDKLRDLGQLDDTLVVLTADHGATYGATYYGKQTADAGNSNWYYAPHGVWDLGAFDTVTYNSPSLALAPLIATGNLDFSYQSTAIEAWLTSTTVQKKQEAAAAMDQTAGVIASYWRDGDRFRLAATNKMTPSELSWWKRHGQEIVNTMAAANGPDVIGLLHDKTSYGAYGDHGGAQEAVQRVPMVFWSPDLAYANTTGGPFRTPDILPTVLDLMGIPVTAPLDGTARPLT
jgi:arylsulfatase A-like enzyme